MNADGHRFLNEEETKRIIGCAMEVLNCLGHGSLEKPKVIEKITDLEIGQVLNYLRITGLKASLILNFKRPKLEWKRIVLSDHG